MTRKKVAIFGSTGQLGTDLVDVLTSSKCFEVIPLRHEQADCTDPVGVREILIATQPQIIINSAAFVRVDDCEDRPEEAFRVNAIGALNIARVAAELQAVCVYISTDYVFDGNKTTPYVESDGTSPINVYGTSKLAGEYFVRQAAFRWLIVRVASLFGKAGSRGKQGNFIDTIVIKARRGEALKVVDDVRVSPTYARDAAGILRQLIEEGATGVVHAANGGSCTWYEFATAALNICGLAADITPVASSAYPTRARRPKNSALKSEISSMGATSAPSWQEGLQQYLVEKKYTNRPPV